MTSIINFIQLYAFLVIESIFSSILFFYFIYKVLKPRLNFIFIVIISGLTYFTVTQLLAFLGFPVSWSVIGPLNLLLYMIFAFRDDIIDKLFVSMLLFMQYTVAQSLQAFFINVFNAQYKTILSQTWLQVFWYIITLALANIVGMKIILKIYSLEEFGKFYKKDKIIFLIVGFLCSSYVYFLSNLHLQVGEVIGRRNMDIPLLVTNSVTALCLGIFGYYFLFRIYRKTLESLRMEQEYQLLSQQVEFSELQTIKNKENAQKLIEIKQNILDLFDAILNCAESEDSERIIALIKQHSNDIKSVKRPVKTQNRVLDYFISKTESIAKTENILFQAKNSAFTKINVNEIDFCAIVSNVLDNAVNACRSVNGERYINLNIHINNNVVYISCENSKVNIKSNIKKPFHGYGLSIIRDMVRKYNGDVKIADDNEVFKIELLIYS